MISVGWRLQVIDGGRWFAVARGVVGGWRLALLVAGDLGWLVLAGGSRSRVFDREGWLVVKFGWWRPLVGEVPWLVKSPGWWRPLVGGNGWPVVLGDCWWRVGCGSRWLAMPGGCAMFANVVGGG